VVGSRITYYLIGMDGLAVERANREIAGPEVRRLAPAAQTDGPQACASGSESVAS